MAAERTRTEQLLERDGPLCVWCGRELWHADLTVEHLCPRSRGGDRSPENCLVACGSCNHARRSKSAVSYARGKESDGLEPQWQLLERSLRRLAGSSRRRHRAYAEAQLRHLGG